MKLEQKSYLDDRDSKGLEVSEGLKAKSKKAEKSNSPKRRYSLENKENLSANSNCPRQSVPEQRHERRKSVDGLLSKKSVPLHPSTVTNLFLKTPHLIEFIKKDKSKPAKGKKKDQGHHVTFGKNDIYRFTPESNASLLLYKQQGYPPTSQKIPIYTKINLL